MKQWWQPSQTTLLSPALDVLMAGGLSVLVFFMLQVFVEQNENIATWSIALYFASFLVNFPHFTSSYQLLYGDARNYFFGSGHPIFSLKLWWAGVVVPLMLIGYFAIALSRESVVMMGYLVNAMYFFVGWHYVKQIFGCVIVLSSAKKLYYTRFERVSILAPLYALWALSFINANLAGAENIFYQIPYTTLHLSPSWLTVVQTVLLVTSVNMIVILLLKWSREQVSPPLSALVALTSIYLWYIPILSHPFYFYIIPLFHSLQYLLFVSAYRRNLSVAPSPVVAISHSESQGLNRANMSTLLLFIGLPFGVILSLLLFGTPITLDQVFYVWGNESFALVPLVLLIGLVGWLAIVILFARYATRQGGSLLRFLSFFIGAHTLGFLLFSFIPHFLDMLVRQGHMAALATYPVSVFGPTLYFFFFTVFLNIHHYFIDNVIWKRDNPAIRAYLIPQMKPE